MAKVTSSVLCAYAVARGVFRSGVPVHDVVCEALEIDGIPCPAHIPENEWISAHMEHIRFEVSKLKKPISQKGLNKIQRKMERRMSRGKQPRSKSLAILSGVQRVNDRIEAGKTFSMDVVSDSFLQSYEWRKLRMEALKLHGARCQCCGATPATGAVMNVDHIKPRRIFPQLALSLENLQVLCGPCNHGKGNWDMTDWRTAHAQSV